MAKKAKRTPPSVKTDLKQEAQARLLTGNSAALMTYVKGACHHLGLPEVPEVMAVTTDVTCPLNRGMLLGIAVGLQRAATLLTDPTGKVGREIAAMTTLLRNATAAGRAECPTCCFDE